MKKAKQIPKKEGSVRKRSGSGEGKCEGRGFLYLDMNGGWEAWFGSDRESAFKAGKQGEGAEFTNLQCCLGFTVISYL